MDNEQDFPQSIIINPLLAIEEDSNGIIEDGIDALIIKRPQQTVVKDSLSAGYHHCPHNKLFHDRFYSFFPFYFNPGLYLFLSYNTNDEGIG